MGLDGKETTEMTDSGEHTATVEALEALEPAGSSIVKWAAGVVLAGLVSGTALLIGAGYGKVQEHDLRLRALEVEIAQSREDRRALHETLLRMEQADSRLEQKLDKLLDRRGR